MRLLRLWGFDFEHLASNLGLGVRVTSRAATAWSPASRRRRKAVPCLWRERQVGGNRPGTNWFTYASDGREFRVAEWSNG